MYEITFVDGSTKLIDATSTRRVCDPYQPTAYELRNCDKTVAIVPEGQIRCIKHIPFVNTDVKKALASARCLLSNSSIEAFHTDFGSMSRKELGEALDLMIDNF